MSLPSLPERDPQLVGMVKELARETGILRQPVKEVTSGEIIDGRLCDQIGRELGIHPGYQPVICESAEERAKLRIALNTNTRPLTREQMRERLADTLQAYHGESNRQIAARVGIDHKTVGKARAEHEDLGRIPKHQTLKGKGGKTYPSTKGKTIIVGATAKTCKDLAEVAKAVGPEFENQGPITPRRARKLKTNADRAERLKGADPDLPTNYQLLRREFRTLTVEDLKSVKAKAVDLFVLDPPWGALLVPKGTPQTPRTVERFRREFAAQVVELLSPKGIAALYLGNYLTTKLEWSRVLLDAGLHPHWSTCFYHLAKDEERSGGKGNLLYGGIVVNSREVEIWSKTPDIKIPHFKTSFSVPYESGYIDDWQQNQRESEILIDLLSRPNAVIGDLTFGAGTVAAACGKLGQGRRFVGTEIRQDLVTFARRRVHAILASKGKATG